MTDPTVAAYYADPSTLVCSGCRAVFRLVADVSDDDRVAMRGWHAEHVCDPDVDPVLVEAVRAAARQLAEGLPPDELGQRLVSEGMTDAEWHAFMDRNAQVKYLAACIVRRYGAAAALLNAASPHVPAGSVEVEPWEEVLRSAAMEADRPYCAGRREADR